MADIADTRGNYDVVLCTIDNTDDPAQLKLMKNVTSNDGGDAGADEWTLNATADTDSGRDQSHDGDDGSFENIFVNNT